MNSLLEHKKIMNSLDYISAHDTC